MDYIVPTIFILVLCYGLFNKVNVYDGFVCGLKKAVPLSVSVFPFLAAMFVLTFALRESGVGQVVVELVSVPLGVFGIPREVVQLVLLRPFSGSGSLAILSDVYAQYGTDSYVGRAASVIMGSSETVLYVAAVYFADTKVKRTGWAVPIALFCNFVGSICACLLCRFL